MAGITPFLSGNTPLKNAPYFSRVASTNISDSVDNVTRIIHVVVVLSSQAMLFRHQN